MLGGLKVDVDGDIGLTATQAKDPAPADQQLQQLAQFLGGNSSQPVELSASAPLPATGALLTNTFDTPLPTDTGATFVYYDTSGSLWTAVPSSLSTDRTTLTTTAPHFSIWGWIEYQVGSFFSQRVDAPSCSGRLPSWLTKDGVTYLDDQNAPLRWCAQADDKDDLLVKARVNRGYGMVVNASVKPNNSFSSYLKANAFDLNALIDISSTYWTNYLANNSQQVPAKQEVTFTFTGAQVRAAPGSGLALIHEEKPSLTQALWGIFFQQIEQYLPTASLSAYLFEVTTLAECGSNTIESIKNFFAETGAILSCLRAHQMDIAKRMIDAQLKKDPKADPTILGDKVGKIVGRAVAVLAVLDISQQLATYIADIHLDQSAYTFNAFPKPVQQTAPVTQTSLVYPLDDEYQPRPGYSIGASQSYQDCGSSTAPAPSEFGGSAYNVCAQIAGSSLDPCWPDSTTTMVCMSGPTDKSLMRLNLSSPIAPLPDAGNSTDQVRPWQIVLQDDASCYARTHGSLDIPGISYVCSENPEWGAVGKVNKSRPVFTAPIVRQDPAIAWIASGQSDPNSVPTKPEPIKTAYFAGAGTGNNPLPASGGSTSSASGGSVEGKSADATLFLGSGGQTLNFSSPSGNIKCVIGDEASCQIVEHDYPLPQAPTPCKGVFGDSAFVASGQPGAARCSPTGIPPLPGGPGLPFGYTLSQGELKCLSTDAGIRCNNGAGNGFLISRATLELY